MVRWLTSQPHKTKIKNFSEKVCIKSISYSRGDYYRNFPKIFLLHSQHVEQLKLWTSFVSFHSALPRNTATQRTKFMPFSSNQVISLFPLFFLFPFLSNSSHIFSVKDMKLQAVVIFTSLQNVKFTFILGYTSCRPTYIESFMTIFRQCINVLNYKM